MDLTGPASGVRTALAASALALAMSMGPAPASASTVTYVVTFSDFGASGVSYPPNSSDSAHGYQSGAIATGSFDITFDPSQVESGGITGVISNLTYSVTDPYFSPFALKAINSFQFAYGTLYLFSNSSLGTHPDGTPNLAIGINSILWGGSSNESSVWYSQSGFGDTLTMSGFDVTVTPTPLPTTLTMLSTAFLVFAFFIYRGQKEFRALPAC